MTPAVPYLGCVALGALAALAGVYLGARIVWRLLRPDASGGLLQGRRLATPQIEQEATE